MFYRMHAQRGHNPELTICGLKTKRKEIRSTLYYKQVDCKSCLSVMKYHEEERPRSKW